MKGVGAPFAHSSARHQRRQFSSSSSSSARAGFIKNTFFLIHSRVIRKKKTLKMCCVGSCMKYFMIACNVAVFVSRIIINNNNMFRGDLEFHPPSSLPPPPSLGGGGRGLRRVHLGPGGRPGRLPRPHRPVGRRLRPRRADHGAVAPHHQQRDHHDRHLLRVLRGAQGRRTFFF